MFNPRYTVYSTNIPFSEAFVNVMPDPFFPKAFALEPPLALMTMETGQIAMNSAKRLKGVSIIPMTLPTLPV